MLSVMSSLFALHEDTFWQHNGPTEQVFQYINESQNGFSANLKSKEFLMSQEWLNEK